MKILYFAWLRLRTGVGEEEVELPDTVTDVAGLIEWGQGTVFQRTFPHIVEFIEKNMERGLSFRHRSLWPRADLLSHPEFSPPGHGSVSYCEADLVWETAHRDRGFGMFRYFADSDYFEAAPQP